MTAIAHIPAEDPLPTSPEDLIARLTSLGLPHKVYDHEAVFTVEAAKRIDGLIPGCHTRNMFLKDKKGAMFLVTLRHDTLIDLKKLSDLLGSARFSFGSPERLWEILGVRPGSVTPFSIINDRSKKVTLVLEKAMLEEEIVNYHPLINTMTVGLKPQDFLAFMRSIEVNPLILDLSPAAPDV